MKNKEELLFVLKDKNKYKNKRIIIGLSILLILLIIVIAILYSYSPYKIIYTNTDVLIGILGGIGAFGINYGLGVIIKRIKQTSKKTKLSIINQSLPKYWFILLYLAIVLIEEIICRSYILYYIKSVTNVYIAIVFNSIIFSLFHFNYKIIQIFLLAIYFSILMVLTENLLVPVIGHYLNNVMILFYKNTKK